MVNRNTYTSSKNMHTHKMVIGIYKHIYIVKYIVRGIHKHNEPHIHIHIHMHKSMNIYMYIKTCTHMITSIRIIQHKQDNQHIKTYKCVYILILAYMYTSAYAFTLAYT